MQDVNLDNHLHGTLFYNKKKYKKMRSLNFQKLNLRKEDILSKTQMKNILGGHNGGGDIRCQTRCSGYRWNSTKMGYDYGQADCEYLPPVGGVPGSCHCPYTVSPTVCS